MIQQRSGHEGDSTALHRWDSVEAAAEQSAEQSAIGGMLCATGSAGSTSGGRRPSGYRAPSCNAKEFISGWSVQLCIKCGVD